jgi:4-hydroxy-3-polyprenylbenzoate decarboxylase
MRIVVGITGSSGAAYAREFLQQAEADKYLVVSKWGRMVLKDELGITPRDLHPFVKREFPDDDLSAPLASGSNEIDACVIVPCSTSTLGKIASGIGDTLITRSAQVALKERHKLIICVRETPLSTVTLEQCAKLSRDGAIIMPMSPPLYTVPATVDEFIHSFVQKLLGVVGLRKSEGWRADEL